MHFHSSAQHLNENYGLTAEMRISLRLCIHEVTARSRIIERFFLLCRESARDHLQPAATMEAKTPISSHAANCFKSAELL